MDDVRVYHAPAKVNLALAVAAPRAGDGLHPICSWMAAISLFDELRLRPAEGASTFIIGWAPDAPQPSAIDWPTERDLICRAHRALCDHLGRELRVGATLSKRIPVGGGLGGGSSDGATMLAALNDLFSLDLPRRTLIDLAATLGSDVPFFLGPPSAIVSGVGEILDPAPMARPLDLVLVTPALSCPTGVVYRKFDELRPGVRIAPTWPARLVRWAGGEEPFTSFDLFNDLAEPALDVEPRLRQLRDDIADHVDRPVHVTGSGACLFVLADHAAQARAFADRIAIALNTPAMVVRTLDHDAA